MFGLRFAILPHMDRPLNEKTIRTRRLKQAGITLAIIAGMILAVVITRALLSPGIKLANVRTAVVERGPVEAVLVATGIVVPEYEHVISCPFDTRVQQVLEQPGANLIAGQILLQLDDSEIDETIQRLTDEIALKRNHAEQLELELSRQITEAQNDIEALELRLEYQAAKTAQQKQLFDMSAATVWNVRQAELDENISRIDLKKKRESLDQQRETIYKQIEGLEIEIRLLQQQLRQAELDRSAASVTAAQAGVLTSIVSEAGTSVREGEILARISDLTRFRVEATLSDIHTGKVTVGQAVRVLCGDTRLSGTVASIPPAIEEGRMTLIVALDNPNHSALRSNMRVDAYVILENKPDALRVAKGPFANGSGPQKVFVIHGDRADRVNAELGLLGMDYYEITSGLQEGDRIIVSSMRDHEHLATIKVH